MFVLLYPLVRSTMEAKRPRLIHSIYQISYITYLCFTSIQSHIKISYFTLQNNTHKTNKSWPMDIMKFYKNIVNQQKINQSATIHN